MRRSILKFIAGAALAASASSPAWAAKDIGAQTLPAVVSACDPSFPNPDAIACAGYFSGNLINGSPEDRANQAEAIALLGYGSYFDGSQAAWDALDPEWKINEEDGDSPIDFGVTLFGLNIVGVHFGNGSDFGNSSVFWAFDFGEEGGTITIPNTEGWSNAVLYTPPPGVPEPATWGMMLLGFGAAGAALRRSRRKTGLIAQIA